MEAESLMNVGNRERASNAMNRPRATSNFSELLASALAGPKASKAKFSSSITPDIKPWEKKKGGKIGKSIRKKLAGVEVFEKEVQFTPVVNNRILLRLERTTGSNKVRLQNHGYISSLGKKIKEQEEHSWSHRRKERLDAEKEHCRQMIINGIIEPSAAHMSLKDHPVYRVNHIMRQIQKMQLTQNIHGASQLKDIVEVEPFHDEEYQKSGKLFAWHKCHYMGSDCKLRPSTAPSRLEALTSSSENFESFSTTLLKTTKSRALLNMIQRKSRRIDSGNYDEAQALAALRTSTFERKSDGNAEETVENTDGQRESSGVELKSSKSVVTLSPEYPVEKHEKRRVTIFANENNEKRGTIFEGGVSDEKRGTLASIRGAKKSLDGVEYIKMHEGEGGEGENESKSMSHLNLKELLRKSSLSLATKFLGLENEDLGAKWSPKKDRLIQELFSDEKDAAELLYSFGNDINMTYMREQAKTDEFCSKVHRKLFSLS